jgi:hypothetical protein
MRLEPARSLQIKDKRNTAVLNRKHQILNPVMKILGIESTPNKKW